jgi:agarase
MNGPKQRGIRSWSNRALGVVATVGIVAMSVSVGAAPAPSAAEDLWDPYGGWTGQSLGATGNFRTEKVDGRWWLVTPDGHPFFSNGLNSIRPTGTIDRNGNAAYLDTILTKYGSEAAWADAQITRFDTWGINTVGGWSAVELFAGRIPYTVSLSLADHDVATGRMADFWSPAWVSDVATTTATAAAGRLNDPWLVGYYLDNELHWTTDFRARDQLDYYAERAQGEAGKVHLVNWLETRYGGDFSAFSDDFTTSASDWVSLLDATTLTNGGPGAVATRDAWSAELAERYFSVTGAALRAAAPNHLNLGTRFFGQLIVPGVLDAAARHVDVISINWYELTPEAEALTGRLGPAFLPTADTLAAHRNRTDKPLLISEFGWRATDSGLPNTWPPLQVVVATQQARADQYRNFAQCLANTGDVVGAHWFGLVDQPAIGRADGENSNWGFVTEGDEEYELLTQAAADVADLAYAPAIDPAWSQGACEPIGPQPTTPTPQPSQPEAVVPVVRPAFTG